MYKRLAAKTQFLNPILPEDSGNFSRGLIIEPDNEGVRLRRGVIYAVFNASGGSGYNTNLITKVVYDILHEGYYQSENISPIQSLEKAVAEVKDKIVHMTNESIRTDETAPEFNLIAGVLWGNVVYMVQFGNAQSYLVRETEVKAINMISEGAFSAASGVVKDKDVIIFCSQAFGQKYPPNKLLTSAIADQELQPDEACMLIKFTVDTKFSPNENVDFGISELPKKHTSIALTKTVRNIFAKLKRPISARVPERAQKESIGSLGNIGIKLKPQGKSFIKSLSNTKLLLVVIVIALAASITYSIKNQKVKSKDTTPTTQEATAPSVKSAETLAQDTENENEAFYDLKIADPTANPTELVAFNTNLVAVDKTTGAIYTSDLSKAKFIKATGTFTGIHNALNIKGKLGFTDTEGYKVYDINSQKVTESYIENGLGVTSAYLDYVYSTNGDILKRYSKSTNTLTPTTWGQNSAFEGARSLAVAYSIYVLTSDDTLVSFTGGSKDNFVTKGDANKLKNAVQVIADIDLKNIYVADSGNNRVVIYDDKGNFVKEIKSATSKPWTELKSIAITSDEKTLFVLNGTRVYKIELTKST